MATFPQMIAHGWPGAEFAWQSGPGDGTDYVGEDRMLGLTWHVAPNPVPTYAEIIAQEAAADAAIAAQNLQDRKTRELVLKDGNILNAVDILADAIAEIQTQLKAAAINSPLTQGTRIQNLRDKITQIKNLT